MYSCVIDNGKVTDEVKLNYDVVANAMNLYKETGYSREFIGYANKLSEQSINNMYNRMNEYDRNKLLTDVLLNLGGKTNYET